MSSAGLSWLGTERASLQCDATQEPHESRGRSRFDAGSNSRQLKGPILCILAVSLSLSMPSGGATQEVAPSLFLPAVPSALPPVSGGL